MAARLLLDRMSNNQKQHGKSLFRIAAPGGASQVTWLQKLFCGSFESLVALLGVLCPGLITFRFLRYNGLLFLHRILLGDASPLVIYGASDGILSNSYRPRVPVQPV